MIHAHAERPDAVIFDFDGVLVDTERLHYRAYQEVLRPRDLDFPWADYVAVYMGYDDRDAFRERFRRAGEALSEDALHALVAQKASAFLRLVAEGEMTPFPGVAELVRRLAGRVPLAVCSGALRSDIDPCLARIELAACFDVMVTANDVTRSKPDPESYALAVRRLGEAFGAAAIRPERCVAIEDTPAGIASARGAGLRVLAVTNSHPPERLPADRVVVSLQGLSPEDLARV